MRIAIFSDVHGNLSALEAVLVDIEDQSPDLVVFAGDLCLFGPRPAECLRLVRERRLPSVIGNTDEWIAGLDDPPEKHRASLEWTAARLTTDELDWLRRLPFALRVSPTDAPNDRDLLIVHANPRDVNGIIFPSVAGQQDRWGKIRQSDEDLGALMSEVGAAVVAYGHLHIPGVRRWGKTTLANISSVSMPGDGDGRAKYGLLEWRDDRWEITHHRVAYDVAAEAVAFRVNRPPGWAEAVAEIEADGYYYPQRI